MTAFFGTVPGVPGMIVDPYYSANAEQLVIAAKGLGISAEQFRAVCSSLVVDNDTLQPGLTYQAAEALHRAILRWEVE